MGIIEQIVLLLISCAINGAPETVREVCSTPDMVEVPYQQLSVDERLPRFEKAHWFVFQLPKTKQARLEVLLKDDAVLQAGVEIVYMKSANTTAVSQYNEVTKAAEKHYGKGRPIDMGGIEIQNYGGMRSVFYVIKGAMNKHPFIVFRAGNRRFWP